MADDRPVSPADAHFEDEPDPMGAAQEAAAADPVVEELRRLRDENGVVQNKLLRLTAEYENYRRRSVADRQEAIRQGRQGALVPLLDVYDDFRRSLEAARRTAEQDAEGGASVEALMQGIELVAQKFEDALNKLGVEPISAVGAAFSEDEHEAMMQQPAPEGTASGTVLAEIQPGYRLGDRVLRHARVIVAE